MRFRTITVLLSATAILAACSDSATAPDPALESELEEVMLGRARRLTSSRAHRIVATVSRRAMATGLTDKQKECIQDAIASLPQCKQGSARRAAGDSQKPRSRKGCWRITR